MDAIATLIHVVPAIVALALLVSWVWTGVWAYHDATRRGKPGGAVAVLVMFVAWPLGLAVWLVLRPEERRPPFNLDDFRSR
ncbi:hypothetical protein QRD43_00905 [Pelomonas sp. APW6]|uniref:Cardiolipin synthase N-terminal domain-containing protein n=1 Tax=Roseateles subflavus TaxID=3053353 RepID=A0ABT7LC70_9BURK|nr:hypothetical protein [Pelomonas sp. APW6]MDL5030448.1 hypothetical protein [Pelomonas sp. APW6]